jgi:hypothetical protein
MKRITLMVTVALVMALMMAVGAGSAGAQGNNPAHLSSKGWNCFNVPGQGLHCQPPGAGNSSAAIPLKVYDTEDPEAEEASFLGTEILIREDLYAGQPCPQEGTASYTRLPFGYYYCHHYDTTQE